MTGNPDRVVPVRLLLAENSGNDSMLFLRELRRGGYAPHYEPVYTPEGMERALGEAEARREPYEVIISDYYMPRFRAPDVLKLLRGLGYDVPFVVVFGKIGEDAAVGIMKAGANDYLTKENMARLCPAIGRELEEAEGRRERTRAEEAPPTLSGAPWGDCAGPSSSCGWSRRSRAPSSSRWRTSLTSTAAWPAGPTRSSLWSGRACRGLPGEREIVRVVQKALTNFRGHSGAGHVRVEIGVEG